VTDAAPLRSLRLRRVLPLTVLSVFTLFLLGMMAYEYLQFTRTVDRTAIAYTRTEMARLQREVRGALAAGDVESAEREIPVLGVQRQMDAVVAIDDRGRVLYATRFAWKGRRAADMVPGFDPVVMDRVCQTGAPRVMKAGSGSHLLAYYPLPLPGNGKTLRSRRTGGLFMRESLHGHHDEVRRIVMVEGSAIWLAGLLAMGVLLAVLKRYVEDPLARLATAATHLVHGDDGVDLRVQGSGEVADLARAFNDAAHNVRRITKTLKLPRGQPMTWEGISGYTYI